MQIETRRLLLRPISIKDLDEFVALHDVPEISRFLTRFDRPAAEERLRHKTRKRGSPMSQSSGRRGMGC